MVQLGGLLHPVHARTLEVTILATPTLSIHKIWMTSFVQKEKTLSAIFVKII